MDVLNDSISLEQKGASSTGNIYAGREGLFLLDETETKRSSEWAHPETQMMSIDCVQRSDEYLKTYKQHWVWQIVKRNSTVEIELIKKADVLMK